MAITLSLLLQKAIYKVIKDIRALQRDHVSDTRDAHLTVMRKLAFQLVCHEVGVPAIIFADHNEGGSVDLFKAFKGRGN